jgi:hypothetical protein
MKDSANKTRQQAAVFRKSDHVWLSLKNIKTPQLSKKLFWFNAKYEITEVISSYVVELNVPGHIHLRFHVDLLKRAEDDPLPSQIRDDTQPPPLFIDGKPEYTIEEIKKARLKRVGRGSRREVLVKWKGYKEETWEPREEFLEIEALAQFERKFGTGDGVGEEDSGPITGPKPRRQGGRRTPINSFYFLEGTGTPPNPGRQPAPERRGVMLRAGSRRQASLRKTDAVDVRKNPSSGPTKPGKPLREWIRIHSSRLFPSRSTRPCSCFSFSPY